jgi:hypothetical protein
VPAEAAFEPLNLGSLANYSIHGATIAVQCKETISTIFLWCQALELRILSQLFDKENFYFAPFFLPVPDNTLFSS